MNRILKYFGVALPIVLPAVALAQTTVLTILSTVSNILRVIIPILVTLAVIYVIWGVIKYATASDDETQAEARKTIISGIIVLFVIVSIWGLVAILNNTFGVTQGTEGNVQCSPVFDPDLGPYGEVVIPANC